MEPEEEKQELEQEETSDPKTCSEGFHWDDVLKKCVENVG